MEKQSYEKHAKYLNFYSSLKPDEEYWGIGIENETYLMFEPLESVNRGFIKHRQKSERYSVDYWKNYKPENLKKVLKRLPSSIRTPTYVNSYLFRHADLFGEHKTIEATNEANPEYSGQTIDEYLKRVSPVISEYFKTNLIYDGDTFEFTTYDFYKTNVTAVLKELRFIKKDILYEINRQLVSDSTIFKRPLVFPKLNYGFTRFLSNPKNIAICNNGTYHINLTLPTALDANGQIKDPEEFREKHANAIRAIQWIEPLLVGLYGTPDILSILDPTYAGGSQRLAFSRYIGLGTYDTEAMEKGKLVDTFSYEGKTNYFTQLHSQENSPYIPPKTIGYDFNYNKFKNHGIELRILDYFPEEYLESVINLIILVCQHSLHEKIPDPRLNAKWTKLCANAIKNGSQAKVCYALYIELYRIFGLEQDSWILYLWPFSISAPMLHVGNRLRSLLHKTYAGGVTCSKM